MFIQLGELGGRPLGQRGGKHILWKGRHVSGEEIQRSGDGQPLRGWTVLRLVDSPAEIVMSFPLRAYHLPHACNVHSAEPPLSAEGWTSSEGVGGRCRSPGGDRP